MILTRGVRVGVATFVGLLAIIALVFGGNQRQAQAAVPGPDVENLGGLGHRIVCQVFTDLNEVGPPIPFLKTEGCPGGSVQIPECRDDIDNDGDGLVDFPADPGCTGDNDETESPNPPPTPTAPQCSDNLDNDSDGLKDSADPGCHSDGNASNSSSYSATDNDETDPSTPAQCADGIDNDGDGKIDLADPGCSSATDNNETDPSTPAQCTDGIDNDGDGKIDFPADPGCSSAGDNDEANTSNGGSSTPLPKQCDDDIDNDGDGDIDFPADDGCDSATDDSENTDSGGGGGGGSGSSSRRTATPPGEVLGTGVCEEYLLEYIKFGAQNNPVEVLKLQRFLRDLNGFANLQETGVYDAATLAAVHEFQTMYAQQILTPWGATGSTGYVYLTTRKTINEIHCQFTKQFPLTALQEAEIARVKAQGGAWKPSGSLFVPPVTPTVTPSQTRPPAPSAPSQEGGGDASGKEPQGAAGGEAPGAPEEGGSWWDNLWDWLFDGEEE